jgi:hypothetical protein
MGESSGVLVPAGPLEPEIEVRYPHVNKQQKVVWKVDVLLRHPGFRTFVGSEALLAASESGMQ